MLKKELAQQLRQKQYDIGIIDKKRIDNIPDDEIIDCYITCSGCGEKQVDVEQLNKIIEKSSNTDEFFAMYDAAEIKNKVHICG